MPIIDILLHVRAYYENWISVCPLILDKYDEAIAQLEQTFFETGVLLRSKYSLGGKSMKLLIAEDNKASRLLLQTRLKKMGHEVIATQDGEEGWHAFVREQPRLVITDWMMPNMDGLQLSRKIRVGEQEQYVYIIMLTALAGKKNYLEGMNAGVDAFLNKPVDMDELTACLRVAERILALESEVKQLEGLLPICSYCKKIRDENNEWGSIEGYISKRTEARFSHGCCPSCYEQHVVPQLNQLKLDRMERSV